MRIYLAASYTQREEMIKWRNDLEKLGHIVTSSWIDCRNNRAPEKAKITDIAPRDAQNFAEEDLTDIEDAELVVISTRQPSTTGGRHVEFGYALSEDKDIILIGEVENIFHRLDGIELYPAWPVFYAELCRRG